MDSPTDKSMYPLPQKVLNKMWAELMAFDGYRYLPPDASPKTEKMYQIKIGNKNEDKDTVS